MSPLNRAQSMALHKRRAAEAEELRCDLELCGLSCGAREAARRCGTSRQVALRVLVPYHRAHGYPTRLSAEILGVTPRTVERYRALNPDGWIRSRAADGRWVTVQQRAA